MRNDLFKSSSRLLEHIFTTLGDRNGHGNEFFEGKIEWGTSAGVLMPLGQSPDGTESAGDPCLVFNKRSLKVRQPGDLCFPGGSMSSRIDPYLARIFTLPFFSLGLWRYWKNCKKTHPTRAENMSIIWATALRESLEEMRLNPFGVKFIGPLPPQSLVMFKRTIYPMVGWINRQKRFFPNWEVEKVLYVSLKDLLNPDRYGRYRLHMKSAAVKGGDVAVQDFPCFFLRDPNKGEILWGATYRITVTFLKYVFDFTPPDFKTLPVIEGVLNESYATGNQR